MHPLGGTYRIIACALAFLMFFTSTGFSVDMHYCQGNLKSFKFFGKAKSCHEIAEKVAHCSHHRKAMKPERSEGCSKDKKGCCHNKTLHFQSDQDQQIPTPVFVVSQQLQQFLIAGVAVFFSKDHPGKNTPASAHYKPPLIPKDVLVLVQSFLL